MKKVLITGKNSYIGTSVEKWLLKEPDKYQVDTLDLMSPDWKSHNFSGYDIVFHVAGIAHVDTGEISENQKQLYYKINCDLAVETANIAKNAAVKQFIFMSSIIVYGSSDKIGSDGMINLNTPPNPDGFYGDSKLQAETKLKLLGTDIFKIVILRPPMIYGKGCKGNYPLLSLIAKKSPIFPLYENQRSMLFINNLCEFVKLIIDNEESGTFFPQNSDYVKTHELVKLIACNSSHKILFLRLFNSIIKFIMKTDYKFGKLAKKAFDNLTYSKDLSKYKSEYNVVGFEESIRMTEIS